MAYRRITQLGPSQGDEHQQKCVEVQNAPARVLEGDQDAARRQCDRARPGGDALPFELFLAQGLDQEGVLARGQFLFDAPGAQDADDIGSTGRKHFGLLSQFCHLHHGGAAPPGTGRAASPPGRRRGGLTLPPRCAEDYSTTVVSKSAGMVISISSRSSLWSISLCFTPGG